MTTDLLQLINNTKSLNETIIAFLDNCSIEYKPMPRNNKVVILAPGGSYKLKSDDKFTLKTIKNEWEYWVSVIEPFIKHNSEIHAHLTAMRQIINCGWRMHDSDIDKLKNKVNELFNEVISTLEIELRYSDNDNKGLNANNLVITINTNSTQIVINNPVQMYDNLIKIVSDSELPESDKNEISKLLAEAKSEPHDISKFKSISNWITDKASKVSPTLNVISSFMGIISSVL